MCGGEIVNGSVMVLVCTSVWEVVRVAECCVLCIVGGAVKSNQGDHVVLDWLQAVLKRRCAQ